MTNYIEKSNAVLKQTGECFKNVCDVLAKTQALNDQPSTNQKKKGIDKNFIAAAKGITDIHKCVKSYKTICKGFAEQFLILLKSLKKFLLAKLDLIKRVTTGAGGGVAGLALGEFAAFVFAWADSKHKAIFSSLSGFAGKVLESISKMLKKLISEGKVQTGRGGAMIYPTTVGTNMMTGLQKLASNGGTFLTTISKLIANWETDPCHLTFYMSNKFSLSAGDKMITLGQKKLIEVTLGPKVKVDTVQKELNQYFIATDKKALWQQIAGGLITAVINLTLALTLG